MYLNSLPFARQPHNVITHAHRGINCALTESQTLQVQTMQYRLDTAEAQILPGSWDLPVSIPQGNCRVFSVHCCSEEQNLKWRQLSRLRPKIEGVLSVSAVTELRCRQRKHPDTQNLKTMIGLLQGPSHLYMNTEA